MVFKEDGSGIVMFGVLFIIIVLVFGLLLEVVAFRGERTKLSEIGKQAGIGIESGSIRTQKDLDIFINNLIVQNNVTGVEYDIASNIDVGVGKLITLRKDYSFTLLSILGVTKAPIEIDVCRGSC